MTGMVGHVATINAFEAKDGTFQVAIRNETTRDIHRIKNIETLASARYKGQSYAWDEYGPCRYAAMKRKGQYLANVWIEV